MRHITTAALMLALGAAGAPAQDTSMTMRLSGTAAPSTVDLQTGTGSTEYSLAGKGTLGPSTLRVVSAGTAAPQPSSTCSGLYFPILAGEGVLRAQDGSLLKLNVTAGSDCIDLAAGEAHCTRIFQITGGTGQFRDASGGTVKLSMTVAPVVPTNLNFFTVTAQMTGTVSGVDTDESPQDEDR